MKAWIKSGSPWIWLNAGAAAISLVMVAGLILLIAVRGLGHFWPADIVEATYHANGQEQRVLGQIHRTETRTAEQMLEAGHAVPEGRDLIDRHLVKIGNRDHFGVDFQWYFAHALEEWRTPADALMLERTQWGDFYGYLRAVEEEGEVVAEGEAAWDALFQRVERAQELRAEIERIERGEIGAINHRMEQLRLDRRSLEMRGVPPGDEAYAEIERQMAELGTQYDALAERRAEFGERLQRDSLIAEIADGREVEVPLATVVRAARPNAMNVLEKAGHYADKLAEFFTGFPREANTEGGIFPAIFGTVAMVLLMTVFVTPIGVLAAIYMREYAKQGPLIRLIRISVNNLAGVPSIVFGVFGLGFFVYILGGSIDQLFYREALPSPTFGSPGLLWASLTLALLTLPVVIVATEEGLTRIPRSVREGSLALGATKSETLWRVVVPMSAPAMMTGLILAVARAAGEVAPLMLVGVVKLAPSLPIDGNPPYVHLDRAFMHLGFHIFDVGFQSPNVEAARPLVYATALTLIALIIVLNLAAIAIRNHLREKARTVGE